MDRFIVCKVKVSQSLRIMRMQLDGYDESGAKLVDMILSQQWKQNTYLVSEPAWQQRVGEMDSL